MPSKVVPIEIQHALGGLHRGAGFQGQPPYTARSMLNVRGRDTFGRMQRGGSRPMLAKAFPTVLGVPSSGTPGSVSLAASKDARIDSTNATTNYGSNYLHVGDVSAGTSKLRTLFHFDLTSIPANATIVSASLSLYKDSSGTEVPIYVRRVRRSDWVEAEVTWNIYKTANNWTTAGCDSSATDYDATNQLSVTIPSAAGFMTIDNLETLCQDAYDNRSDQLHIILVGQSETASKSATFRSKEYSGTTYDPVLTINYVVNAGAVEGQPVRMLAVCDSLNADGTVVYTDEFSGASMSADWDEDENQAGTPTLPSVSGGLASTSGSVGVDRRSAVLEGVTDVDTAGRRSVSMKCVLPPSDGNQYIIGLDYQNVLANTDGVQLVVENTSSTHLGSIASWTLFVDGVSSASGTIDGSGAAWLKLTLSGTNVVTVHIGPTGNEQVYTAVLSSYTPGGTWPRFLLIRSSTSTVTVSVDTFRFEYISTAGGDPRNMLMASAGGALWKQNLADDWTRVSSTVTLASDRLLRATHRLQKLYIADYEVLHTGSAGATSSSATPPSTTNFDDPDVSDWTAIAGMTAGDFVRIKDGSVVLGDYRIQSVAFGNLTILGGEAPGNGSGLVYEVLRGPKQYDAATNQLTSFLPVTAQVPAGCTIVETWLDALVWGGDPGNPHRAFKSKSGDPTDYDYGTGIAGSAYAYAASEETAEIGDKIRAISSPRDDYLLLGGERNSFKQAGDPNLSGGIHEIAQLGILDKDAWARTPDGLWIAMTTDGLYRLAPSPGARPEPMSKTVVPRELRGISSDLYDVQVHYDQDRDGVHVYVTPKDIGATTHWFYDLETEAFEPMSLQSDHEPTASCEHRMPGATPTVFLGGRDGYVRIFVDGAETDDGEEMESEVTLGPIKLGRAGSTIGRITETILQLASGSDDVEVLILVGNSPETAFAVDPRSLGTVTDDGKPHRFTPFATGAAAYIRLSSTGRWARESLGLMIQALGKLRAG